MSKVPQIRVYAGKPLRDFLSTRPLKTCWQSQARVGLHGVRDTADEITENVAINRLAERHEWLMRKSMPDLSDVTWLAVLNACNSWTEHTISEIEFRELAGAVLDDCGLERGDEEGREAFLDRAEEATGVEIRKLMALSPAETLAVIEGVERYWGRQRTDDKPFRSIVENWDAIAEGREAG